MELSTTGTTTATSSGSGSKYLSLKTSFRQSLHFLLTEFPFEDFCKAFPSFTRAEQGQLFQLYVQFITSLYEHMLEDFDLVCHETKVGTILDGVEDLVEQQSLDPLCFQKSNLAHVRHELLTMKQKEVSQLQAALDKVEDRKHSLKAQIKLLKNSNQNPSVPTEAIEKFKLAMEKIGDYS